MQTLTLSVFFLLIAVVVSDKYTTKYDNIDIDQILNSERLLKNYFDCVMERGKCTPDGKELKDNLSDSLKTDCEKCSEKQKANTVKVLKFLVKNKRPLFDELSAKFDPENSYRNRHKDEFAKEGITL